MSWYQWSILSLGIAGAVILNGLHWTIQPPARTARSVTFACSFSLLMIGMSGLYLQERGWTTTFIAAAFVVVAGLTTWMQARRDGAVGRPTLASASAPDGSAR